MSARDAVVRRAPVLAFACVLTAASLIAVPTSAAPAPGAPTNAHTEARPVPGMSSGMHSGMPSGMPSGGPKAAYPTGSEPARTQSLTMNLTDLTHATADLGRTRIRTGAPLTVDVTSDGVTSMELDHVSPGSSARIGNRTVAVAQHATISFSVLQGTTSVTIRPEQRHGR